MWFKLSGLILRNRIAILIGLAIITSFMLVQAGKVKLSYELPKLVPDDDPTLVIHKKFKKTFGEDGNMLIIAIESDSLYTLDNFNAFYELGNDLKKIQVRDMSSSDPEALISGVDSVFSVAHMFNLIAVDSTKKMTFEPIVKRSAQSQAEVDSLRKCIESLPFYENLIYTNEDKFGNPTQVSLMMVFVNNQVFNTESRGSLVETIKAKADVFSEKHINVRYSGLPYIRTIMVTMVKKELAMFVLLAVIVTGSLLFFFFRSLKVVIFSLLVVIIGVIWSLGTMGLFDYEMSILQGLIPPLIIVIGIPNCVYLFNKYQAEYKLHQNKVKALSRVIQKIGNATFMTNATTAMGFGTFIFTESAIMVEFGVVASINILVVFLLSILIIPIVNSYSAPPKERHTKHLDKKWLFKTVDFLEGLVVRRRTLVYVTSLILLIAGVYGMTKMHTTGNLADDIPQGNQMQEDLAFVEKNFNGVMPFEIVINSRANGRVTKLRNLKKIEALQESLDQHPEFSKSLSIVDAVKFARQALYNGRKEQYKMITGNDQAFLNEYLESSEDSTGKGKRLMSSFLDSTQRITRVTVQVKDIGTRQMDSLLNRVRPGIEEIFNPNYAELDSTQKAIAALQGDAKEEAIAAFKKAHKKMARRMEKDAAFDDELRRVIEDYKYEINYTGNSIVILSGTTYLVKNLFTSLLIAICVIAVLMSILFNSFRMVMISLIPNLLPLILTASLMGYFQVPIKPSTILVFSIAFGISIDDTIHFLAKYRQELKNQKWDIRGSVLNALRETGISMIYTSIILYFGFGIFCASDFGGTIALGLLVSITLIVAMFTNLVLLPSLLLSFEKRVTTKAFKEPLLEIIHEEEDIELEELEIKR